MRLQAKSRHGQRGYAMMTLLLILAIMAIMAITLVTSIKFDIKRDREEEMIHRGVQYSRAIRAYYKKFGRYPATLEQLENTNQLRFLRKRYKDPLTGKDFRLLHFGEVKMSIGGMSGGAIPGASTIGQNGQLINPNSPVQNSAFGGTTNSTFGQNSQTSNPTPTTDATNPSTDTQATQTVNGAGTSGQDQGPADKPVQSFGGMPIVGVASLSKDPTIREFDKKKKYNEWQFVYDPTLDRGFLITTPYQPQLQMFGTGPQNINGPNAPGQNQPQGLGGLSPTSGFQQPQQPAQPPNGTNGNPNQPTDTPNQQ